MRPVILDTTVLAAGFIGFRSPNSAPGKLIRRWRTNAFTLVISEHIFTELAQTLEEPYFTTRFSREEAAATFILLRRVARIVEPMPGIHGIAGHPEDDLIIATAVAVQPALLVTGDERLRRVRQYQEVRFFSPRGFLMHLETQAGSAE